MSPGGIAEVIIRTLISENTGDMKMTSNLFGKTREIDLMNKIDDIDEVRTDLSINIVE